MTRRPTTKRVPRLRSDAVIPPEKYVKVPPFLDALVFIFACFLGALYEFFSVNVPCLGRVVSYVLACIQYRASLYLRGIRWYNIDRLGFGGAATLIDLALWDVLQPAVGLVATAVWIAALPWRDAPLTSVFTRHSIMKTRIQICIDSTAAFFSWPFTLNACKSATKLYQCMNQDSVALRRAKKSSTWSDAYTHFDFVSSIRWKTTFDVKTYCILVETSDDERIGKGENLGVVTGALGANAVTSELENLANSLKFSHNPVCVTTLSSSSSAKVEVAVDTCQLTN